MGNTDMIVNALRKRDSYIEFQTLSIIGSVDSELDSAYQRDPRLYGCVKDWSGNKQSGQGLLHIQTAYRITVNYLDNLPPYDQIVLDDGKWLPSDEFKRSGWKDTVWVVSREGSDLQDRIENDWDALQEMQPTYRGMEGTSYWAKRKDGYILYELHFRTVVSAQQAAQYAGLADRQAQIIVANFFGRNNVMTLPPIVRAYMAFSYLQQNCEFDGTADETKDEENPFDPYTHTAYGPLCRGSGIAIGIADAYRTLLGRLGIHCLLIHGEALDGHDYVKHTWCQIEIGRDWFHSDPTYGINGPKVDVTRFIFDDAKARTEYAWNQALAKPCYQLRPNYKDVSQYVDGNLGRIISMGVEERYISDDYVD